MFTFSRERGYFGPFVSGRFSREKPEKGVFVNQSPKVWGIFQKLPQTEKGYDTCMFLESSIASRENVVGSLLQSDLGYPATSGPAHIRISDLAGYERYA